MIYKALFLTTIFAITNASPLISNKASDDAAIEVDKKVESITESSQSFTKDEMKKVANNFEYLFAAEQLLGAPLVRTLVVTPIARLYERNFSTNQYTAMRERLVTAFRHLPGNGFFLQRLSLADEDNVRAFLDLFTEIKSLSWSDYAALYKQNNTCEHEVVRRVYDNVLKALTTNQILQCAILRDLAQTEFTILHSGGVLSEKSKDKIANVFAVISCSQHLTAIENKAATRAMIDIVEKHGDQWKTYLPQ